MQCIALCASSSSSRLLLLFTVSLGHSPLVHSVYGDDVINNNDNFVPTCVFVRDDDAQKYKDLFKQQLPTVKV